MILGNSNGNNKGKKYFKMKNVTPDSPNFPDQAHRFDLWFIGNMKGLRRQLFEKYPHSSNEDIFNDTYLRIHERIYFTGFRIADYKSYFCRAFYTNHIQELSKANRYADIDVVENTSEEENNDMELEQRFRKLEEDIFGYVYLNFELREYEIFKMYMRLKIQGKNMTYEVLADIIGGECKPHHIQSIISKIKKSVVMAFSNRWKG